MVGGVHRGWGVGEAGMGGGEVPSCGSLPSWQMGQFWSQGAMRWVRSLAAPAHVPLSFRMSAVTLSLGSRKGSGGSSKLFQMENDEIVLES